MSKIKIGNDTVEVNIEMLAKAIAVNYADWKSYMGQAERIAQKLPEILKCVFIRKDK